MLTEPEADEIEHGRHSGVAGPIVLKWIDQLLADRRERIQQLEHLRKRLNQAFRYLDGLVRDVQEPQPSSLLAAAAPACPKCGKGYDRVAGLSPRGMVYFRRIDENAGSEAGRMAFAPASSGMSKRYRKAAAVACRRRA